MWEGLKMLIESISEFGIFNTLISLVVIVVAGAVLFIIAKISD